MNGSWPALAVADWTDSRDTFHMFTQIVGKIRLKCEPMVNHWWQVPLYVSARGLTTGSMPYAGDAFDMEFDLVDHVLRIRRSDGRSAEVTLRAMPVAEFYAAT